MAKPFTSAEIQHTHTHTPTPHAHHYTHAITLNQSLSSFGNVHSTILSLSVLYPLVHPLLSAPSVPITTARNPDPWNTIQTDRHKRAHTQTHSPTCKLSPHHNNTKGQSCFGLLVSPLCGRGVLIGFYTCVFGGR